MRSLRRRYARVLVVFSLLLLALPATGTLVRATPNQVAMQQTAVAAPPGGPGTQVVPSCDPTQVTCNTYEYSGGWVADPATTVTGANSGFFAVEHQLLAETSFQYFETPWVQNHVPDNEALVQGFALAILSQMGQTSPTPFTTGTLADGTVWHLYAVTVEGATHGLLISADTADPSQNDVTTMLSSPASSFDQALAAVQTDIRVNGVSPLADIDPTQVMTALGGGAAVTPATGTTPAAPPAPTPAAPSAALDQSTTVGTDNIVYGGEWTYDSANSAAEIASFRNSLDPRVIFTYGQGPDRMSGGDVQMAVQILDAPTAFAAQNAQQIANETLPSGRAYALYRWEREGTAEVALFVVDVTTTPGTLLMQVLFTPPDQFVSSLSSVQQSFQINGVAPFSELDPATLAPLIGGGAAVTPTTGTTPAAGPTPTPGEARPARPPRGETTTPAVATTPTPTTGVAGQSITVAGASITYTAQWVYDNVNSEPDGGTYFDAADGSGSWFGYLPAQPTTGDATAQLADFTSRYFQNIGATEVQQLTLEALSPTSAWALSTANLSGLPIVVLTYADTATAGALRIQMLFSPQLADIPAKLTDVQGSVQIDGVPAFTGVDPAAVAALLGGGMTTTPVAGTTPAAATTVGTGGSVADYQALDAPTGCDGIGWVVTDPSQAPVSQADRDYRSACVGGATYTASCGLYGSETAPLVLCTVDVTVADAPMTVSVDHFTLVDGAGVTYQVDLEALTVMVFVLGTTELPEASVSSGSTVSGTLLFAVPPDAPGPWVLQVAPEAIATTGEAPGRLVIEGTLQPVDIGV